jgi:LacI family transcriptional regulator
MRRSEFLRSVPIRVPDIVTHTGLSRRSLERRFTATLGHTLLEEITRCRLDRAKRLLLETDLSIERVALAAGFSATKRMTHAFRESEGTLPHRYRQMHKSHLPAILSSEPPPSRQQGHFG